MIEWEDRGVILSVRPHGETGGIASVLTHSHGRAAGYVYGVSSSRNAGTLQQGNVVSVRWQAKAEGQLGAFTLELEKGYAADAMDDPLKLTALQSACAVADRTLPEHEGYPGVFDATVALLDSFRSDIWALAYVYWELGLLRELGFGLDLSKCVVTGSVDDLAYVSPKSGCAVSESAGAIYKEKLLSLPSFLKKEGRMEGSDIEQGLKLTGYFLLNRVFSLSNNNLPEPRLRLEEKWRAG